MRYPEDAYPSSEVRETLITYINVLWTSLTMSFKSAYSGDRGVTADRSDHRIFPFTFY